MFESLVFVAVRIARNSRNSDFGSEFPKGGLHFTAALLEGTKCLSNIPGGPPTLKYEA